MTPLIICLLICVLSVQSAWVQKTSMPTPRSDMYADTIGNSIYVVGGCIVSQSEYSVTGCPNLTTAVEIYDPVADSWTTGPPALTARYRHSTSVVGQNLWILSGRDGQDNVITSSEYLDTATGSWTAGPELPLEAQTSDGYAFTIGQVIYYVGGYFQNYTSSSSVFALDTSQPNPSWTQVDSRLETDRGDLGVSVLGDIAYLYGGFNSGQGFCQPLKSTEENENLQGTWSYKAPMLTARGDAAEAVVTVNGVSRIFVVGGETVTPDCASPLPILEVESYYPDTNTWNTELSLPGSVMRFAGEGYADTVFIFGGQIEGIQGDGIFEVYSSVFALVAEPVSGPTGTSAAVGVVPGILGVVVVLMSTLF